MKNSTKLLLANAFALFAVVLVLTGAKVMGVQVGLSGSMLANVLLIVVPQLGFAYFYLKPSEGMNKKVIA